MAELHRGRKDFDVGRLVAELAPDQAKTVLADIQRQMQGGPARRLTIHWRIDEDKREP